MTTADTASDRAGAAPVSVEGLVAGYGAEPVLAGVDLAIAAGETLVLLGPSGCGKTTLLRCIAGLEPIEAGVITIGGRELSRPGKVVPPEKRGVGMVFQDGALFPHLSVARNIGYGLPRAERAGPRVHELIDMIGLTGYGDRRPGTLSGGQQQRVALARALAPRPSVLLLDEPFSSLDTALRVQIRQEVHRLLVDVGVTSIFVTHDQSEAFVLGDRVAVMADGGLVQVGTPANLYRAPATPWLAGFVGEANLLPATATGDAATATVGIVPLRDRFTGAVTVLCRPEQLHLDAGGSATVEVVEYYGHDTRYDVRQADGTVVVVRETGVPAFGRGAAATVTFVGEPACFWPA